MINSTLELLSKYELLDFYNNNKSENHDYSHYVCKVAGNIDYSPNNKLSEMLKNPCKPVQFTLIGDEDPTSVDSVNIDSIDIIDGNIDVSTVDGNVAGSAGNELDETKNQKIILKLGPQKELKRKRKSKDTNTKKRKPHDIDIIN